MKHCAQDYVYYTVQVECSNIYCSLACHSNYVFSCSRFVCVTWN